MSDIIYRITTDDLDRERMLGYASGDKDEINRAFQDKAIYGLNIEPITVQVIDKGYTVKMLQAEKQRLLEQIRKINKDIEDLK